MPPRSRPRRAAVPAPRRGSSAAPCVRAFCASISASRCCRASRSESRCSSASSRCCRCRCAACPLLFRAHLRGDVAAGLLRCLADRLDQRLPERSAVRRLAVAGQPEHRRGDVDDDAVVRPGGHRHANGGAADRQCRVVRATRCRCMAQSPASGSCKSAPVSRSACSSGKNPSAQHSTRNGISACGACSPSVNVPSAMA